MPYTNVISRRKTGAIRARRHRLFTAAVRAGDPKALEAERLRTEDAMKPATDMYAEIMALPSGQGLRAARKAEYDALYARCLAARDAAPVAYARLRAEVVAEMEAAKAAGKA